jgi:D-tyrosyl-tRNA(Tyr) deacylase
MPTRLLVQQADQASLLIDNDDEWVSIERGVVIYICFLKGAENDNLEQIITKILSSKLHVIPGKVVRKQAFTTSSDDDHIRRDLLLVPQATLAAKLKKSSSPQFHDQIDKELVCILFYKQKRESSCLAMF